MKDRSAMVRFPRTPITVGIVASLLELACFLLVHGSHRGAVAIVSGQAVGGELEACLGALVVLARMASVLVLPPVILAACLGCILHVVASRAVRPRPIRPS